MPRRGFTLIEMVFVVTTIALVAAIALPRFAGASDRHRLLAAGERVAAEVAMLREHARASSGTSTLRFGRNGYTWNSLAGGEAGLSGRTDLSVEPYSVTFRLVEAGGDDTIIFDGYGLGDSSLKLILGTGDYRVEYEINKAAGAGELESVRMAEYRED